ncbi:MAG TPA: hypothetical protein VLL04_01515 [Rhizomicrobium sp.]|nr:hypothetical protein [Rhizomicrobium sp.]
MDIQTNLAAAKEALRHGSLADAESQCKSILALFPRHHQALALLGEILRRAGRRTEATSAYNFADMAEPGPTFRSNQFAIERFRNSFGPAAPPRLETVPSACRVQMRSLGQNGRFGNQLLQYGFTRLYARRHDLVAEFPDWIGRDIFDFDDAFPSAKFPTVNEVDADLFGSLQGRTGQLFAERDIEGYFCGNTKEWSAWRDQFRLLFSPGRKVRGILDKALDDLHSRGETIVAIHLRQGNYGFGRFWVAPTGWYLAWLRRIWPDIERPVLYIASDVEWAQADFADFSPMSATRLGVDIPGADFLVDHHILRHANHLAISNSSFSFTAAMLNAHAESFMRPDPTLRELVVFDPWASEVLQDVVIDPQAVAAGEQHLIRNRILPTDTVVYWGNYCSAWTNFARSVHGSLRIFETEGNSPVTDTLHRRKIRQVRLLVLENTDILCKFFNSTSEIIDLAQVDMVLFRADTNEDADAISRKFSAAGYTVFLLLENAIVRKAPRESNGQASYLAMRHDLAKE